MQAPFFDSFCVITCHSITHLLCICTAFVVARPRFLCSLSLMLGRLYFVTIESVNSEADIHGC